MTETQTDQTIIGDDGELTVPAPGPDSAESVYAALPQLFLLDSSHAAYIAGKKLKPAAQTQRRAPSVVAYFWLLIAGIACICIYVIVTTDNIVHRVETLAIYALFLVCAFGFAWLKDWLSALENKCAERNLFMHGVLLKGEVVYYRKSHKRRRKPSTRANIDLIHYCFTTPQGRTINETRSFSGERRTDQDLTPIRVGTPVAVLYLNDKNYMLL
jgi:hypothetical protein